VILSSAGTRFLCRQSELKTVFSVLIDGWFSNRKSILSSEDPPSDLLLEKSKKQQVKNTSLPEL